MSMGLIIEMDCYECMFMTLTRNVMNIRLHCTCNTDCLSMKYIMLYAVDVHVVCMYICTGTG